jgi:uncharacterized membrane protein YdcZ (DUF606 family)
MDPQGGFLKNNYKRRRGMKSIEKKRLWMFIAIAYGVTVLMSLLMIVGKNNGKDLTAFVNVQMAYPMCGVILGKLFLEKKTKSSLWLDISQFL